MQIDLKGKRILVTGASGFGVGAGVCEVLSACGATVLVNARSMEQAEEAAAKYPNAIPIVGDISKPEDVEHIFKQAGVVHGLVNNAGIGLSKPAHEASIEEFDRLYGIDVRGLWMMSRAFVRQLQENSLQGNIVNISSVHAHSTMNGYGIYASAKAAIEGLTRGMSVELGKYNIRVNAVSPGYVHAEQNYELIGSWTDDPKGWVKQHSNNQQSLKHEISNTDCGNSVAFLLSDLARSITGQSLYIDNGMTCMLYNNDFIDN